MNQQQKSQTVRLNKQPEANDQEEKLLAPYVSSLYCRKCNSKTFAYTGEALYSAPLQFGIKCSDCESEGYINFTSLQQKVIKTSCGYWILEELESLK